MRGMSADVLEGRLRDDEPWTRRYGRHRTALPVQAALLVGLALGWVAHERAVERRQSSGQPVARAPRLDVVGAHIRRAGSQPQLVLALVNWSPGAVRLTALRVDGERWPAEPGEIGGTSLGEIPPLISCGGGAGTAAPLQTELEFIDERGGTASNGYLPDGATWSDYCRHG
jgi:hypothetical protein